MLEAREICKTFRKGWRGKSFSALQDVSLTIKEGETLGLMGPSGCGKSTLARILLRLIPADSGEVLYKGKNYRGLSGKQMLPFRKEVQLISQRPQSFFDPSMKLGKSMVEPLKIFGLYKKTYSEEILAQTLYKVKLNDSLLERYPHQVSGGEIQRLSICRALLLNPKVLILDEATSMLDISVQAQILHILKDLKKTQSISYLFISHDRKVVEWMSDRVLEMKQGKIIK